MKINEILAEGTYRQCYATENPEICVKRLKPNIDKQYFGINFTLNMNRYLKFKFGISDINKVEYSQITRLPDALKAYIPSNIEWTEEGLFMGRPRNYTGEYSINMIEFGKVKNEYFWNCVDEICGVFEENDLWYQDIFFLGNNILVKKVSKDKFIPIMIDLKNIGRNLDPMQLHLIFRSEMKRKFYRRFNKFKAKFYTKT